MKVVNDKNLSVEQLIMVLAERQEDLYLMYEDMMERTGNSHETNCAFHQWNSIYSLMQELIIGVEDIK
jgi:hypothetical protein